MRASRAAQIWYICKLLLAGFLILVGIRATMAGIHTPGGPTGLIPLIAGLWLARRIHALEGIAALRQAWNDRR